MNKKIYCLIDGGVLLGIYAEDNAEVYLLDLDQDDLNKSEALEHFNATVKELKNLAVNSYNNLMDNNED